VSTEAVAPRDIDVLSHNLFEVSRDSCVRKEVVGHTWREIDEQIHVAVGSVLGTHDGAEYRDVNDAALAKFTFVGAQFREDVGEKQHGSKLTPSMVRLQRAERGDGGAGKSLRVSISAFGARASYEFPTNKTPSDCVAGRLA
jgi:hypothetical protein